MLITFSPSALNDTTPAAPAGNTNVTWQLDGSGNASGYVPTVNPGTVTSVDLSAPGELIVTGGPVTSSGTLALAWATQNSNLVFAGPSSGAAATPGFRLLVAADMPVVTTPYLVYMRNASLNNQQSGGLTNANSILSVPFNIPYAQKVTNIVFNVTTADGTNNSDIGIFDLSGNLMGHVGAATYSTTGKKIAAISGGPITLPAGTYVITVTSAGTTLQISIDTEPWLNGSSNWVTYYYTTSSTSTGGALPSTITLTNTAGTNSAPANQWTTLAGVKYGRPAFALT